jgi:hypothetical protein
VNKRLACSLICFALVASLAAVAADDTGITLSADGRTVIAKAPSKITLAPNDSKLSTIAGNLSIYPYGVFFCCFGNTIAEGGTNFPFQTWVAIPFTPAANATITRIEASVGAFSGILSGFELSIRADNSGKPGKVIKSFHIAKPPTYGQCCVLDVGNDTAGIPVKAKTQYWIAATTTSKDTEFLGGWAFNSTDMRSHTIASWCKGSSQYCGSNSGKWVVGMSGDPLPAFAVLGH